MRRRDFIATLGGAAVVPLAARAQQQAMPVIGFFNSGILDTQADNLAAFRKGLNETGFSEGKNVAIEFHWAENQFDRLPAMASEVIARRPAVIVSNTLAAMRVKAATATIPIVFTTGSDPVRDGLVASLNRPGGNVTGVVFISGDLGAKRLGLLRQLVPQATTIAVLIYPNTPETEAERKDLLAAAQATGQQLLVFDVKSASDIASAIATAAARGAVRCWGEPVRSCTIIEHCSSSLPPDTRFPPCIQTTIIQESAAWRAMEPICLMRFARPASMWGGSSRARSRQTCR